MRLIIDSTSKLVELNGVPARIWVGQTDSGIPVHCFVTRVAVHKDEDSEQFDRELQQHTAPSADVAAYPLRLLLD